jgi:hypothetical protein
MSDAEANARAHTGYMTPDVLALIAFLVALVALDYAALRKGVDSRFIDVRSDF